MNKLKKTTLGTLIELQRGFDLPKSKFIDGKYPVQSSNGVLGFHNEYKVKGPGITIGRSGTVGIPHLIQSNFYPHNTALFIKDFKGNNIEYIFYLLKQLKLGDKKSGSGVPTMNRNHLHPLKIVAYLDTVEQSKIAKVLSDLDKKIELNNKINAELESVAKLIYDYWFVQFDFPNAEGKPYKSSGGKMVWNDDLKREIPEGWESKTIESVLAKTPKTKKIPSSEYMHDGDIPIIDQSSDFICGYTDELDAKITITEPKIIFGDHTRIVKLINFDFARGADGTQIISSTLKRLPQYLFYQSVKMIDLSNYGYARHFKFLKQQKIIIPGINIAKRYDNIANNIFEKRLANQSQNIKLEHLRDWLLPMLMNGQVTVGAEKK